MPLDAASLSSAKAKAASLPDVPPHLKKCADSLPGDGKTADDLALKQMKENKDTRACYRALLAWYRGVQSANGAVVAETKKTR